jgi:hypothetical protein
MEDSYQVVAYSIDTGNLVYEVEVDSYNEALQIAQDIMGEHEVVIYHPDGEEEVLS